MITGVKGGADIMTTHFTSGVTNVVTGGTGEKLKQPDPIKYHVYHEDFDKYTASDWVITTTEAGGGDATEALGDGDGGLLVVTNDAADNDSDEFQWAGGSGGVIESFKYEAAKGLYFKTRFKVSDATQSDFAIGLIITDTTIIDGVTDGIFFEKDEQDLDYDAFSNYFKWIDSSISYMVSELFPVSARHSSQIMDVVESHVLERNKYQSENEPNPTKL